MKQISKTPSFVRRNLKQKYAVASQSCGNTTKTTNPPKQSRLTIGPASPTFSKFIGHKFASLQFRFFAPRCGLQIANTLPTPVYEGNE